jgi:dTDP-4-amino-4,6-dideoxygalactose transaminase
MTLKYPYVKSTFTQHELGLVTELMERDNMTLGFSHSALCTEEIARRLDVPQPPQRVFLTPSCTSALEVAALLSGVGPGDEVILPSYTFSSNATAFALRGATLVFVDSEPGSFNIDPEAVRAAVTPATRVVIAMHYCGVSCDMDRLSAIARDCGAMLIEDAAQAYGATAQGQAVGTRGDVATFSFHHTKNLSCGEGGALVVNNPDLCDRAAILLEKGTNRSQFFQGLVDKYSWVDLGTSGVISEIAAAVLLGQLRRADEINGARIAGWNAYHAAFAPLEQAGLIAARPHVPEGCVHNGHIYFIILPDPALRPGVIAELSRRGISAPFHYVPLHDTVAGRRFGRVSGQMVEAHRAGSCLLRLPLWPGVAEHVPEIVAEVEAAIETSEVVA